MPPDICHLLQHRATDCFTDDGADKLGVDDDAEMQRAVYHRREIVLGRAATDALSHDGVAALTDLDIVFLFCSEVVGHVVVRPMR